MGDLGETLVSRLPTFGQTVVLALLLAAISATGGWYLVRGLRSGLMSDFGSILAPNSRATQPVLFWMRAALNGLQCLIFGSLLIYVIATSHA